MRRKVSRRDFLKLSALAIGTLAFRPLVDWLPPGEFDNLDWIGVGRVTVGELDLFKEPDIESEIIDRRYRDQMIPLYEEIKTPGTLPNHPRWYRLIRGYANSAYLQRVEGRHLNEPVRWVPEEGVLGEVTVPYTRAYWLTFEGEWEPLYRLYYQSVHWITGVEEGPDGRAWYKLKDELLKIEYHIDARHMRLVDPDELTPISPEVPWEEKRIEVSLKDQIFTAYERGKVIKQTLISSGIPNLAGSIKGIPTATPTGKFNIEVKMPSKHMGDGVMTSNIDAYELPGVPWVSFFHETGVAFHGTFWHDNFGRKMSHGCVNMTIEDAKWLYRWSLPEAKPYIWEKRGFGTPVVVY
jgi:hypothetical protein